MIDHVEEALVPPPCKHPTPCEDTSTHTFQYGGVEFLICCNHAEEAFQRILNGESIEEIMFDIYKGEI